MDVSRVVAREKEFGSSVLMSVWLVFPRGGGILPIPDVFPGTPRNRTHIRVHEPVRGDENRDG